MRARPFLSTLLFAAAQVAFSGAVLAQPAPPPQAEVRAEPETQPEVLDAPGRPVPLFARATRAARVALDRPTDAEISQRMRPPEKGMPLQIAFGRDTDAASSEAQFHGLLAWEGTAEGGSVAAIRFESPGASALRIALRVMAMPLDAVIRFHAPGSTEMFEVSGEEILDTIGRNLEAGDDPSQARIYWSPVIEGDSLVAEFELAASSRPADLHVAVPHLSHFVTSARADFVQKASSTCELDVMCYQGTWGTESNSVARMIFQIGTSGYLCTGTLLVDRDTSTTIPYFITANHCIGTQSVASTLQTYWFYRSSSCNGGAGAYSTIAGGAALLYATSTTDTSFMKLNTPPPTGATYAGWTTGSIWPLGTNLTGIHHPKGDLQKISFASLYQYATCTSTGSGTFSCGGATTGTATFLGVTWSSGLTEPGSSGSALFVNNGHYLVGQLYGGSSACGTSIGPDFYGRFDVAYNAALSQWLSPVARTLTVGKSGTGTGTVTSSPAGINCGSTCSAAYSQGTSVTLTATPSAGMTFSGWGGACFGTGSCVVAMSADTSVSASFNDAMLTPGAPQNLAATPGNGQATFTFSPPSNTGGSAIVRYTVTCNPGALSASAAASPITLAGMQNGVAYTCSATATNATTTGPASSTVTVTPAAAPLALAGAVSRKNHGFSVFELPINTSAAITGPITVEPRQDLTHRVVFKFNGTVTTGGVLTVTDAGGAPIGSGSVSVSSSEVTVTLTGVDGRRVRVALAGVNGTLNVATAVGFLAGDEDGDAAITAADILRMRGRLAQATTASNFPFDVSRDGTIGTDDLAAVKAGAGSAIR